MFVVAGELVVDGQVVFELMLNTAQRLADILGGEIRGPNHSLINENRIHTIRSKIKKFRHTEYPAGFRIDM